MWIRSQNKKVLKNCEEFKLYENKGVFVIEENTSVLGKYSTETKALIVLNVIQNSIRGRVHHNLDGICDHSLGGVEFHSVFNMPKDEEVNENEH